MCLSVCLSVHHVTVLAYQILTFGGPHTLLLFNNIKIVYKLERLHGITVFTNMTTQKHDGQTIETNIIECEV